MARQKSNDLTESDRRSFFRIDDSIQVGYRVVSKEEVNANAAQLLSQEGHDPYSIASQMHNMRLESAAMLRRISDSHPDVGAYLASLERRLEILARAVACRGTEVSEQPVKSCNISASGMALHVAEELPKGTLLELKMLLMPSYIGLVLYGEVVNGFYEQDEHGRRHFAIRVNFTHVRESDRELLIKHIIQRQGEMLRQRREQGGR